MSEGREDTATRKTGPMEHMGVFAELLGAWYPKDYIVSVIDDVNEGERAAEELRQVGFPASDVRLFRGEEVVGALKAISAHRNVLQRLTAAIQREVTEEGLANKDYDEDAMAGRQILTVMAVKPEEIDRAREVLVAHGARRIIHYKKWTITDLR